MATDKPRIQSLGLGNGDLNQSGSEAFFDPNSFNQTLNFDEPDNENNMLRDADGQIKGASFAKIICKMVDPQNFGTFLMSSSSKRRDRCRATLSALSRSLSPHVCLYVSRFLTDGLLFPFLVLFTHPISEVKFVMDMLFTYRSFATSFEVLGAMIQRYEISVGIMWALLSVVWCF